MSISHMMDATGKIRTAVKVFFSIFNQSFLTKTVHVLCCHSDRNPGHCGDDRIWRDLFRIGTGRDYFLTLSQDQDGNFLWEQGRIDNTLMCQPLIDTHTADSR